MSTNETSEGAGALSAGKPARLALLWRGDRQARRDATPQNNRLSHVFEALAALGIRAEPAVYADDLALEVRDQLLKLDGVFVWVNPISDGQDRTTLDAMLRDVASRGVWVSAHPDVILKMGVKEVLHRTKRLGWGTDTHLYRSAQAFREEFPARLQSAGPRVLKQNRGNGGQGVWKVELVPATSGAAIVRVLQAARGSVPEDMSLGDFMTRCGTYFAAEGSIVDQPFQPRLPDGMIRCYMSADKVVGFGHQLVKALIPPPPEGPDSEAARPGPRIMHPASAAAFQALRTKMEAEWTPQMMQLLDIDCRVAADHLGCGLSVWAAHRIGRRHLCALRDQCQFGVSVSRTGAFGDRATRLGSSSGVASIPLAPARNPRSCARAEIRAPRRPPSRATGRAWRAERSRWCLRAGTR